MVKNQLMRLNLHNLNLAQKIAEGLARFSETSRFALSMAGYLKKELKSYKIIKV